MELTQEELVLTIQNLAQEIVQLSIDKAQLSAKLTIANNKIRELTEEEGA